MSTIIDHGGKSLTGVTVSGTPGLYVVGPPKNRQRYNGDVQGLYSVTASGSYRWIHDEPRSGGAGPRTAFAAR